ncbi:MAG: recombinase family protein [Candidatus Roizmanbacteria bacterium]|nr:recombinase family protein [Candidatus Roizmanbacteria bacterium]
MKAAIYARVSTEKQEEQKTIASQIAEDEILIQQNGDTLIETFSDEGYSGTILARPALDRLRDEARKKSFERLYIHSPDRLARKYAYQVLILDELKKYNVEVIFKNMKTAETPEDNMLLGLQGIVAEYEKVKIVERTRRGRLFRAKSNHVIGNIPPYGYICIPKNQTGSGFAEYKINESEAKTVRDMFKWLTDEQLTTYKIIDRLQTQGITARKGNQWARSSVHKILRNETYCGTTFYNKHFYIPSLKEQEKGKYSRRENTLMRLRPKEDWIPIQVPAIISKETFSTSQNQLKQNALMSNRNSKHTYMLKGLIKCGVEMGSMHGIPVHGKRYYRCYFKNKLNSPVPCKASIVKADTVESIVWNSIQSLLTNPNLIKSQFEKWISKRENNAISTPTSEFQNKSIEQKLLSLKSEENNLLRAFSSEVITLEQLKEQNNRILKERKEVEKSQILFQNQNEKKIVSIPKKKDYEKYVNMYKSFLEGLNPTLRPQSPS